MKKTQQGIIKALVLLVVAISVLFVVFAMGARYIAPVLTPGVATDSSYSDFGEKTNPLLDFTDSPEYGSDRIPGGDTGAASKYVGKIYLSSGSAGYSMQPNEEYITIKNEGAPVNITGWKVQNGKGTRPIEYSQNSYVYPSPEVAYIGQGTEFLDPSGNFIIDSIILGTGDTAIVTTGKPFSNFPLSIYTNFRENMCLGYLENYPFNPSIDRRCPYPTSDPAVRAETDQCYDYLRSLSQCENPEKTDPTGFDEITSHCKAFIKARLNYPACVANNKYSTGFASKQWRIFLGRSHEMWADSREIITLYDATGLIVDQISY